MKSYNIGVLIYCVLLLFGVVAKLQAQEYLSVNYLNTNGSVLKTQFSHKIEENQIDSLVNNVKLFYLNSGYFGCSVDSIQKSGSGLNIYIFIGERYKITHYSSDSKIIKGTTRNYLFRPVLNVSTVQKIDNRVLSAAQNSGYPFATLSKEFSFTGSKVYIDYKIMLNGLVVYDTLKFEPDNLVSYSYLSKKTRILSGAPFNLNHISQIKANTGRDGFFKVDTVFSRIGNAKALVALKLRPESQNNFSALIGLQQGESGKAEITGNVSLNLLNVFHEGEAIDFYWQKSGVESQNMALSFVQPYILKLPVGINLSGLFYKQDTLFTNAGLELGITVPTYNTGIFSLITKWVSSSATQTHELNLQNSKTTCYGLGYKINRADGLILLKKGLQAVTKLFIGKYSINSTDNSSESFYADGIFDIGLAGNLPVGVIYFKNRLGFIFNDSVSYNSIYRVGGSTTMRGFYENSIYTKRYNYGNLEYRLFIGSKSYVYFFYDAGAFEEPVSSGFAWQFRQALGSGLTVNTAAGVLSLSYAIGKTNSEPFLLNRSKIHIGYINYF